MGVYQDRVKENKWRRGQRNKKSMDIRRIGLHDKLHTEKQNVQISGQRRIRDTRTLFGPMEKTERLTLQETRRLKSEGPKSVPREQRRTERRDNESKRYRSLSRESEIKITHNGDRRNRYDDNVVGEKRRWNKDPIEMIESENEATKKSLVKRETRRVNFNRMNTRILTEKVSDTRRNIYSNTEFGDNSLSGIDLMSSIKSFLLDKDVFEFNKPSNSIVLQTVSAVFTFGCLIRDLRSSKV